MAMARPQVDLTRLTQSELLQLVNATPLAVVLKRSRLRRQMDTGAMRFGEMFAFGKKAAGAHFHLVRYVRWAVLECVPPRRVATRGY